MPSQLLLSLSSLRDAQGDSRVNVWRYVEPSADRATIAKDMQESDSGVDEAVAAYLTVQTTGNRARLMREFAADFAAWKQVRDTQVRPLADAGQPKRAMAVVYGALATANDKMSGPLDELADADKSAANATMASSSADAASSRLEIIIALIVGIVLAGGLAWLLVRRVLRSTAVVVDGLGRLAAGDLTWQCPPQRGRDELTTMARRTEEAAEAVRGIVSRLNTSAYAYLRGGRRSGVDERGTDRYLPGGDRTGRSGSVGNRPGERQRADRGGRRGSDAARHQRDHPRGTGRGQGGAVRSRSRREQ